jgi:hypothetical protein
LSERQKVEVKIRVFPAADWLKPMEKQKTWFDDLKSRIGSFLRIQVDRRWLFVVFILVLGVMCGALLFEWTQRGDAIEDLKSENKQLKLNLRLFEAKNRGLREVLAPLISQAYSEFPEDEITQSLKKIIVRLDSKDALKRPITSVLAIVEIVIQSDLKVDNNRIDSGGYLALCRNSDTLLSASSDRFYKRQSEDGKEIYRGVFQMSETDSAVGRPLNELDETEYLKIGFFAVPQNSIVVEGKVIIIIDISQRFDFQIPPQKMQGEMIFMRGIGSFIDHKVQQDAHSWISKGSSYYVPRKYTNEQVGRIIGKYLQQSFRIEVRGPLSIEQIEEEYLRSNLELFCENVRKDIPKVPFGFSDDNWLKFKMQLSGADRIYHFISEKASWAVLCGCTGYALIREGQVIDIIITAGN